MLPQLHSDLRSCLWSGKDSNKADDPKTANAKELFAHGPQEEAILANGPVLDTPFLVEAPALAVWMALRRKFEVAGSGARENPRALRFEDDDIVDAGRGMIFLVVGICNLILSSRDNVHKNYFLKPS